MDEFKDFKAIPQPVRKPPEPVINREKIHFYDPRPKETVVNSEDIKWKPVDIVAARVVSKAPWYCQVKEKPKFMHKQTKEEFESNSKNPVTPIAKKGQREPLYDMEKLTASMVDGLESDIGPKTIEAGEKLVSRAREVTDAIGLLIRSMGPSWDTFHKDLKQHIADLRQSKIALEIEVRQLMVELKEVREFLSGDKYDQQIARLKEFITLCHQLKELQQSGFLDAMADTILKL